MLHHRPRLGLRLQARPCLKIATKRTMYDRMAEDMDVNCGGIIAGSASVEAMGREIFGKIIATASGTATKPEAQRFGDNEFMPCRSAP